MELKDAIWMVRSLYYGCPRYRIFNACTERGDKCYLVFKRDRLEVKKFDEYNAALDYGRE